MPPQRKHFKKANVGYQEKLDFIQCPWKLSYNIDNIDDLRNAERILQYQKVYDLFSVKNKKYYSYWGFWTSGKLLF